MFQSQRFTEAIQTFTKGLELDPSNAVLHSNRSGAYCAVGNYSKALEDANVAALLKPEWAKAHSRKGAAYHGLGNLPKARECYMEAVRLEPGNTTAQEGLEAVEKDLKKVEEKTSGVPDAMDTKDEFYVKQWKERGNQAFVAQEFSKAVHCFTKGLEIQPHNELFWSNRSAAYCSLQEYGKALADSDKVIELKPDWAKAYSRRAAALHGLQRYEEAIAAYKKGLELDPSNIQLQKSLEVVEVEYRNAPKRAKTPPPEERFMTPKPPE
eukprot:RCo031084